MKFNLVAFCRWRVNYGERGQQGGNRNYRGDAVHPRAAAMSHLHQEDMYRSQGLIHGTIMFTLDRFLAFQQFVFPLVELKSPVLQAQ